MADGVRCQASGERPGLHVGQDSIQDAIGGPAAQSPMIGLPRPIALGAIPPRRAGRHSSADASPPPVAPASASNEAIFFQVNKCLMTRACLTWIAAEERGVV